MLFWLSSNSQQSSCLCFPSTRNKEVSHCALFQKSQLNCQLRTKPLIHETVSGYFLPRPLRIRWPVEFMLHAEEEKAIFSFKKISYKFHTVFLLCHLGIVKI